MTDKCGSRGCGSASDAGCSSTEAAFTYYKSVFGTDYVGQFMRFGDMPPQPGQPPLSDDDKKLVMHCSLPIQGRSPDHGD